MPTLFIQHHSIGNPTEEKQCELDEFIEFAKLVISAMGYKFLVPIVPDALKKRLNPDIEVNSLNENVSNLSEQILSMSYKDATATGIYTEDGFVVLKGSSINPAVTTTCPEAVLKNRKQNEERVLNGVLQEDILFKSPSGAATFIAGAHINGKTCWVNEKGQKLAELLGE